MVQGTYKKNSNTFKFQRMCPFSTVKIKKLKFKNRHCLQKYVNQSFPITGKQKEIYCQNFSGFGTHESDYYVVKFWQKSGASLFFERERVKPFSFLLV